MESRCNVLPNSYSPLSAPSSWKDRETWPETVGFLIHQRLWLSKTPKPTGGRSLIRYMTEHRSHEKKRRNAAVGLCLFQNHSYLSINFTRHFLSCLKRLEIGIPDAQEVWKKKQKQKTDIDSRSSNHEYLSAFRSEIPFTCYYLI